MVSMTVPIKADVAYKNAFAAYCRAQGKTMSEVVKDSIDAMHVDKLKPYLDFFANTGTSDYQTENESTKPAP